MPTLPDIKNNPTQQSTNNSAVATPPSPPATPNPSAPKTVPSAPLRFPKKPRKILVISVIAVIILIAVALGAFLFFKNTQKPAYKTPTSVSNLDKYNQQIIKNITGYDWSNFPPGFIVSSSKPKLAATLLLYSEETAIFWPEVATVKLRNEDVQNLGLKPISTEPTKENINKLIDNSIAIEKLYGQKGLIPAQDHIKRLETLKKYFANSQADTKLSIPEDAKQISSGIKIADNQKDYIAKMLERFNNWLKEYISL